MYGRVVAACFLLVLAGCSAPEYSGDGTFVDHGAERTHGRYELDLGEVLLATDGRYEYTVAGLPRERFVFGFEVAPLDTAAETDGGREIAATVGLTVVAANQEPVVSRAAQLGEWTWSVRAGEVIAFVYGRDGNGTYVDVDPRRRYSVVVTVTGSETSDSAFRARLKAVGGGWK